MAFLKSDKTFETVALPYLDTVYRAAVVLCAGSDEAEDITQITFLKAMEKFSTFETGSNPRAWLLAILRNAWIDEMRRRKNRQPSIPLNEDILEQPPCEPSACWTTAQDILENFSDEEVIRSLRQLPEDQRLTLFLMDVEQYSQEEVAQITDTAVGTVKSRTSRARHTLRELLKKHANEMGYGRAGL